MFALKGVIAHWVLLALFMLHGKVQAGFVIDQGSCTGQDIARMLTEVSQQAGLANQATSGSLNSQLSQQAEILVSNTFDSFFGSQMTQDSSGNSQQAGQLARAQTVITILQRVSTITTNEPDVTIFCNDNFLVPSNTDINGNQIPNGGFQLVAKNMNPPIWVNQGSLRCQDLAANGRKMLGYGLAAQPRGLIVICPDTFTSYSSLLGTPDKTDFTGSGKVLDDFRTVSGVLFHELLHILFPNMLGDTSGGVTGERYGYADCFTLRQTNVGNTVQNPDSISLYSLALTLQSNDWSSGTPQPLPVAPATNPRIRRYRGRGREF